MIQVPWPENNGGFAIDGFPARNAMPDYNSHGFLKLVPLPPLKESLCFFQLKDQNQRIYACFLGQFEDLRVYFERIRRKGLTKGADGSTVASILTDAGWSSPVARRAHNPKVVGSNPAPATNFLKRQ